MGKRFEYLGWKTLGETLQSGGQGNLGTRDRHINAYPLLLERMLRGAIKGRGDHLPEGGVLTRVLGMVGSSGTQFPTARCWASGRQASAPRWTAVVWVSGVLEDGPL